MKYLLSILLLCSLLSSYAQPEIPAHFDGNLNRIISKSIKYPVDLAQRHIQGLTIIAFNITDSGVLDSVIIEKSPHQKLSELGLFALTKTTGKWIPARVNGVVKTVRYKLVINYTIQDHFPARNIAKEYFEKANKIHDKGKSEKALAIMGRAIKANPYYANFYRFRSTLNTELGNLEEADEDASQAVKIKKEVLAVCDICMIGIVRRKVIESRVVPSQTRRVVGSTVIRR
ncbi:MAG TPA: energy transducer TonB [Sunxiuqinia sp.]|nr:energy transducer TonB [Sunxiuqinia sp.]